MPNTIELARPGRPVDLVVCTHLDGLSKTPLELERDIQTRKDQISRVFGIDDTNIVMATPVWGLGAHILLSQTTDETKPEIDFKDGRFDLEVKCIIDACGNERIYKRSDPSDVKKDFEDLYTNSKILGVITTIRTKVLLESRSKRTLDDMNDITPYIGRLLAVQNQRLKLARTEQAELERMTREFSADKSLIQNALEQWRREEYSFISSARDKVEARLHGLLNPPSRSIVGEAAREVRDEWQQRGDLKIKMNPGRSWLFEDRSRNDLDAKVSKFFDDLCKRIRSRFEDKLLPIVQEACQEAGDAPLRKLKSSLNALRLSSGYKGLQFNAANSADGFSDEFELGENNMSYAYEDHRYGMNWKDAALWGSMLAVAPVMAPFAIVGSVLRAVFRKDKTLLGEDQTINGLQASMEEILSQAMPKCRNAVEDAVLAAFRAGTASVERDLARRQSLFEEEAAKRETRTSSEIAEMLIVYSNLVSSNAAAEGLLKCLRTSGMATPGVVPSIKASMKQ
ncbi:hypothetical protein CPB86DRAFT_465117 [Serendipita vermifera]|nr:hypothetical protein CPB86DRAFT_465117 [Serendipita vermifera]